MTINAKIAFGNSHINSYFVMTPLELAQYYLDCYYKTGDFKAIRNILADDLQFNGPFQHFESAASYVNALANNPPKNVAYKMIKSYCDETSACLVYQFLKPGVSTPINQTFWIAHGKIYKMLLIFDRTIFQTL